MVLCDWLIFLVSKVGHGKMLYGLIRTSDAMPACICHENSLFFAYFLLSIPPLTKSCTHPGVEEGNVASSLQHPHTNVPFVRPRTAPYQMGINAGRGGRPGISMTDCKVLMRGVAAIYGHVVASRRE